MSERTIKEFKNTASVVQKHPWDLAKANKYLNDLCDANSANTVPTPPELYFIFEYTMKPLGSSDPLLPGLVFDNTGVGDPRIVELQVKKAPRGKPAAAAKAPARKRPAAAVPLKRPAAAKKRPAAAAAAAPPLADEEPPQDDEEDEDMAAEPEEDGLPGAPGDEDFEEPEEAAPPEGEDMSDDEQGDGPPAAPPGPPAPHAGGPDRTTGCSKCRWVRKGCRGAKGGCRLWAETGHKGYHFGPDGETVMRGPV